MIPGPQPRFVSRFPLLDIKALNDNDGIENQYETHLDGLISAIALAGGFSFETIAFAQAPSESFPPVASVKQLMLDLTIPLPMTSCLRSTAAGLKMKRSGRRAAQRVTLAESGNMLMMQGRARIKGLDEGREIVGRRRKLAYKAAQAKDGNALAGLPGP